MDSNNTKLATRTLETPGSRLDFARDIILALTNGDVDMNNENGNLPALIFKNSKPLYSVNNYYTQGGGNYTVRISKVAGVNTCLHIPNDDNLTDFDLRYRDWETDRKSTRLNSSHRSLSRMPSSA